MKPVKSPDGKSLVDETGRKIPSIRRQCELLGIPRSVLHHTPKGEGQETVQIMNIMDEEYNSHPHYGSRSYVSVLKMRGYTVGRKRIRRLMALMNIAAICPKRKLSRLGRAKYVMPYLLRHKNIEKPNQVWSIDITYIKMNKGYMYQIGILDIFSRYAVGRKLTNSLDRSNVLDVLKRAVEKYGAPEIINSDQGAQFTCHEWIERFWRSLKTEYIYICTQDNVEDLRQGIENYINYSN